MKMIIIYTLMLMLIGAVSDVRAQQRVVIPQGVKTIKLHDNKTGEPIGTITLNGNQSYLRDKDGVHLKTIVRNQDGSISTYDPHGVLLETNQGSFTGPMPPKQK